MLYPGEEARAGPKLARLARVGRARLLLRQRLREVCRFFEGLELVQPALALLGEECDGLGDPARGDLTPCECARRPCGPGCERLRAGTRRAAFRAQKASGAPSRDAKCREQ